MSWTAPMRLLDIEIADSVSDVAGCDGYVAARALVRNRATPLGWVNLSCTRGVLAADDVLAALRDQLDAHVRAAAAHALFGDATLTSSAPAMSVVVCTRDRPALLTRCLRSLAQLRYPSYEIVVVDNASSSDETRRVALAAGVQYVREDRPGLDHARNRGLASARHDLIAFTDDDVEVDPLWLQGIATAFEDPTVQFVTGLVVPASMDTEAELLFELAYGGMGKGMLPRRWDPARMAAQELIAAHHVGVGANMAFRRSLLESLGGFDPALDVGTAAHGGGDLDIFHRALMLGAVGRYEPRALVRHNHRREMTALRRQHYDNGRAFGVYLLRILGRGYIPRSRTLFYAWRVWLAWLVRRLVQRILGRDPLPASLILAELQGALQSPWAYFRTYRQARPHEALPVSSV